ADVGSRHQTQSANQSGTQIGHDVAVEIFAEHYIELLGPHHQLHRRVVDDHVLRFDVGITLSDVFKTSQEKPIRQLHDVGFVHSGDLLALFAAGISKRKTCDARGSFLGNDLQTLDDTGN